MFSNYLDRFLELFKDVEKKGFFHLVSANLIIGFLGFGSQLLVAKYLTPVELGQIKTIQAFINVATIIASFGFGISVLKLCSEKRSLEEKAYIFKRNLQYASIFILITLGFLLLIAELKLFSPDGAVNKWMPIYMFIIPASVYTLLIIAYLQALKKIQLMAKVQVLIRMLGFIILVYSTYQYGLAGFFLSSILVGYIALVPLYSSINIYDKKKSFVSGIFKQSFYYARWSVAGNAVNTIGNYLDIFLLNYLIKDRVSFGYYSLATIFIFGMNQITGTVQAIATPYFSEKSNNKEEFLRVLKKYQKMIILLALGITIVAIVIVPMAINIIYGREFVSAGRYFRILTLRYLFWSCYALLGVAILGLGKMKYNFYSSTVFFPISLILSYLLILHYGIAGAAIAQAIASLISLFIMLLMFKHVINIHFNPNK